MGTRRTTRHHSSSIVPSSTRPSGPARSPSPTPATPLPTTSVTPTHPSKPATNPATRPISGPGIRAGPLEPLCHVLRYWLLMYLSEVLERCGVQAAERCREARTEAAALRERDEAGLLDVGRGPPRADVPGTARARRE